MTKELSQEELDERVAILRRFRSLLEQQRNKFREYLLVLEKQEGTIEAEDPDAIIAHSELEEQIVRNIGSLQKVIAPMQQLYQTSHAATYNPQEAIPIDSIQNELSRLQTQVLAQNEKNRALLRSHISSLRTQMAQFKNPYNNRQSVYAGTDRLGTMIQVEV
ncbi:MAG TPA: flagellar biosynthesis protein FlgN [Treponema sp.]|jgi:hypothetical protein|nr:flagellar biosynthesis protein FlgN [Treponema sp.]HBD69057.1 flagellar biosynthesis protein FlgN [Treponema sp.]